jgi:hypothetical protein
MIRTISQSRRLAATPSGPPTYAGQTLTNGIAADGLPLAGQYTAVMGPYGLGWQLTGGTPGVLTTSGYAGPVITAPAAPTSAVSVMPSQSTKPVTVRTPPPTAITVQPVSAAPVISSSSSLLTTADLETVSNLMLTYGDTWDNASTIVNRLYAAGAAPGSITDAIAMPYLTNIGSTTAAATSSVDLTSPSTWPWYYWAAGAGAVLLLMGGRKSR